MENVKVTLESKENCVRILDVEVPADEVNKEIDKLFDETRGMAQVPGFRPGKAPRKVLEKRFGKEIREKAIDSAVAESYEDALKSEGLSAIGDPDIQEVKFEGDEPLRYRAVIEVPPRVVELGEYRGLVADRRVREITERDIEQVLENTRQAHAVYLPREAKPASDGDLLVIDYEGTIEEKPFEGGKGESVTLLLGGRGFFQEFNEGLRGLIPESETDIKVRFPEDYDRKDLAGREAVFHVKVKEVKEQVVPELNDEFAKEAGNCDTVEELRKRIREQLETAEKDHAESDLERQVLKQIVKSSTFELPKSAIEPMADDIFDDKVRELRAAGLAQKDIDDKEEELHGRALQDAEVLLKIACAEREIANREGLVVTDEEIEGEKADLKETGIKPDTVDDYFDIPDLRERYRLTMLRRKALELVIEAATIKEVTGGAGSGSDRSVQ